MFYTLVMTTPVLAQETRLHQLISHQQRLRECQTCDNMIRPVITCEPVLSKVVLVGQAPGDKEGVIGKPFGWTAGKTLFKWFASQGASETAFRRSVYIASVCRCFPGKKPKGGDRVPDREEITNCRPWMDAEFDLLQPELIILVGKLAISQFLTVKKLTDVIGQQFEQSIAGKTCTLIPLPHPSGASTWHQSEPGSLLLQHALIKLGEHPAWSSIK
ncbi:MAG: uracil-DNA glycosylase family protein [Leucothrix sp.]